MNLSLTRFKKDIKNLEEFMIGIEEYNSLISYRFDSLIFEDEKLIGKITDMQEHHKIIFNNRRLFDYKTIIISLYGLFEYYIEESLKEYLMFITSVIPDYLSLPEQIRTNHLTLSTNLANNLDNGKYKDITTEEEIISNLYCCIKENKCCLNVEAFTEHKTNFRSDAINEFFKKIGIKNVNNQIKQEAIFKQNFGDIVSGYHSLPDKKLFEQIDQLVEWRNEIAHGAQIDNIISNEIMLSIIKFIESYGIALNNVIKHETLPFLVAYRGTPLGNPLKIIDNSIICIHLNNTEIKIGYEIIAESPEQHFNLGKVIDLECDNEKFDIIPAVENIGVGIKVDFYAKANQKYYLLKKQ